MKYPLLTVVICTYNRVALLREALVSLALQDVDKALYEVLVVDNNSTDGTQDFLNNYCSENINFRYVFEPVQGLSRARNRGWQEARGQYVAYIDDDAKASKDWCRQILEAFSTGAYDPVAVGGDILPWFVIPPPEWFPSDFEKFSIGMKSGPYFGSKSFCGSNMAFTREILAEYGGFNEKLGMKGDELGWAEETELFVRLAENGEHLWYCSSMIVYHFVPEEKMKLTYHFFKSYHNGKQQKIFEKFKVKNVKYNDNVIKLLMFIIYKIPKRILLAEKLWKNELFFIAKELGFRIGAMTRRFF